MIPPYLMITSNFVRPTSDETKQKTLDNKRLHDKWEDALVSILNQDHSFLTGKVGTHIETKMNQTRRALLSEWFKQTPPKNILTEMGKSKERINREIESLGTLIHKNQEVPNIRIKEVVDLEIKKYRWMQKAAEQDYKFMTDLVRYI